MGSCQLEGCAGAIGGPGGLLFAQLLNTILSAQCALNLKNEYPADRTEELLGMDDPSYDFVIVGGGSAGSVLASRLTEVQRWKVLLIEAGEDPSALSEIPGLLLTLQGTEEDYAYEVEPQANACQGMKGKRCRWSKGKALGGSSVINAMLHVYGNDRDYDNWAKLGNTGWSYQDVFPYFLKSLNCPPGLTGAAGEHCRSGGLLDIRSYNYTESKMHQIVLDAARELGIPILESLNAGKYLGYGKAYGTLDKGRRVNVAKAFLAPARDRPNLRVVKSARVVGIAMEGDRASGVHVTLRNGRSILVKASKEVIMSAGSVATPQILMLSGIGPRDHLREMKIDTIADLPVGKNLQDHVIWLGIQLELTNHTGEPFTQTKLLDDAYDFLVHRKGEFVSTGGVDLLGFVNLRDPQSLYPDLQFHHAYFPKGQVFKVETIMRAFNIDEGITAELVRKTSQADAIFVCSTLLKPKSLGEIKLRSADPKDPVKIYANYFTDPEDEEVMLKSVDFVKTFLETKIFKDFSIKMRHFDIPGCSDTVPDSREYWKCSLSHVAGTVFHAVGTARMGPKGDPRAVVDPRLKVHGVQRLRVIDASVMPVITSGNTHAPVIMIAEKGSDLIKQEWLSKDEL
ncbi:glucose dehydrogenase [FAD, quinone] [Cephus cinctus]|uniref:Glucose dehydrogenase [FAD, quinone] n=1 Tax=Cephus cinctus TaxID=211228 RepID=A0AAJ7W2K7_CEPCN|nr:glucose dehydrogenase [FAD, quinone] [Cephus cinctus]XP_024941662.1 glucose dehydrogenase [FAD, quinone] [Cephus cinctus]